MRTPDGRPAKGDFSIAVTDRSAIPLRTAGDIYSTLVLSSELRGVIEEPDYYFNAQHADAAQALLVRGFFVVSQAAHAQGLAEEGSPRGGYA